MSVVEFRSDVVLKTPPRHGSLRRFVAARDVTVLPYFHGLTGATQAEAKLREPGEFLLRRDPPDSALVLSVRKQDNTFHHQLVFKEKGESFYRLPSLPYVESEEEFVNYFFVYQVPLIDDVFLLSPVPFIPPGTRSDKAIITEPRQGTLLTFGKPRPNDQLPYYHGVLGVKEAEVMLRSVGDFLVRLDPRDSALVLSGRGSDATIHHVLLPVDQQGMLKLPSHTNTKKKNQMGTLEEFINYLCIYKYPIIPHLVLEEPINK